MNPNEFSQDLLNRQIIDIIDTLATLKLDTKMDEKFRNKRVKNLRRYLTTLVNTSHINFPDDFSIRVKAEHA